MDRLPTLKQLRYFVALAEEGHYRKAAERAGISQPSLSLQIGNLEEVLRLQLVERGRAGAVLTPGGREVLARARRILGEVSALTETSDRIRTGLAGTIRLGSTPTSGPYLLPKVVRRLHELYPALRIFIRDGAPRDLLRDLLSGGHDLILVQLPVPSADVVVTRLYREPLRLAVARDHPLAGRRGVTDADLGGENILALSSVFALHSQIADVAEQVGATLSQDYQGTSLDTLRQMVAMGMGISFLPVLYVQSEVSVPDGDVVTVPFRRDRLARSIGLVWRKTAGENAAFAEIANVIRAVARENFGGLVSMES
ncbi:hydrogen peroxide-inducible genes activator [Tropicimonas isoalkanivorans]|uniref:Transcriptional regulator, LysR family n=1 Tax=Tropicimonas isoalkanivorans TaxID=441112 RepID=A0A1I1GFW2_9RHOB|nr:hydrogen peroxide-inducible genes activator [Tropicimonas isoalkanivorans]SFC10687.1 transcriptional regulator, LysR family [Tropicimonas isoalkanivorans]